MIWTIGIQHNYKPISVPMQCGVMIQGKEKTRGEFAYLCDVPRFL